MQSDQSENKSHLRNKVIEMLTNNTSTDNLFSDVTIKELLFLINASSLLDEEERLEVKAIVLSTFREKGEEVDSMFSLLVEKEIIFLNKRISSLQEEEDRDEDLEMILDSNLARFNALSKLKESKFIFEITIAINP